MRERSPCWEKIHCLLPLTQIYEFMPLLFIAHFYPRLGRHSSTHRMSRAIYAPICYYLRVLWWHVFYCTLYLVLALDSRASILCIQSRYRKIPWDFLPCKSSFPIDMELVSVGHKCTTRYTTCITQMQSNLLF